jgi:phage shock protein C
MYCNACGQAIADQSSFCSQCGHAVGQPHPNMRLVRPRGDRKIAGVCAGFARHLDLDVTLVRILWVFLTFAAGFFPGIIAYALAWIIMPEEPALPTVPVVQHQQSVAG